MTTDLSPAWNEIVSCGREFRSLGAVRVILTHVLIPGHLSGPEAEARMEVESYLKVQARQLASQGLEVILEIPVGLPGQSLNRVARKHDAALLVLGTHGKSLWREGVLGSFSSAVLHQARYPVLLLPVRVPKEGHPPHSLWGCTDLLRHVLFPTDFSEIAAEAMLVVELLVPRGVSRVTLLHAKKPRLGEIPGSEAQADFEAPEYNSLEILKNRLEAAGLPRVHGLIRRGHPVPMILETLKTEDISLIIMGTQGRGFVEELFLGSVAHNISRLAACPVLLVPWIRR